MRQIEWTEPALEDLAALDKGIAGRMKRTIERFAETGAGNVKKLQGINPPEFRLRVGDWRVRFQLDDDRPRPPHPQPQRRLPLSAPRAGRPQQSPHHALGTPQCVKSYTK